ncbi:hypothetical protein C8R43DRAFT_1021384, partial [Mycena crocata]
MMVASTPLPNLGVIRIVNDAPRLGMWLTHTTKQLVLEDFCVPADYPLANAGSSSVTHLVLTRLTATLVGRNGELELSCVRFFNGLDTPHLRVLEITDWNVRSRAWADFIATVLANPHRYANVERLQVQGMHFIGMAYHDVRSFLVSFPALKFLSLARCWPGTWEMVTEVLDMDNNLCMGVTEIHLSRDVVLDRDNALPFRNETVSAQDKGYEV